MKKLETKEFLEELLRHSTSDWAELCTNCQTLIKEADMSDEDIDKIVEEVKRENG